MKVFIDNEHPFSGKTVLEFIKTLSLSSKMVKYLKYKDDGILVGGNRVTVRYVLKCGDVEIPVADISDMCIHGRHALVFNVKGTYYELLPAHEFSIQQFLLYYNCCKNK